MPHFGQVLGKGDAMWRALGALEGEIVCYLDADSEDFSAHFATGLLGPLVCEPGVEFVKAFYRRPFEHGGVALPEGGGRVNHLTARPALALFYPQLAEVRQPLAGEVAARRGLLERLPFATGYGVEIGMLIDAWTTVGLEGIAQVDLEVHRNRHQPLAELTPMATTVLATIAAAPKRTSCWSGGPTASRPTTTPRSTRTPTGSGSKSWTPRRSSARRCRAWARDERALPVPRPRRHAAGQRRLAAARRRGGGGDRRRQGGAGVSARGRGGGVDVGPAQGAAGGGCAAAGRELLHLRGGGVRRSSTARSTG